MGTFVLEGDGADFNLAPRPDVVEPIPEEQRKISQEVYEARNILVLLRERGVFRNDTVALDEFITRVRQAATVGCVNNNVQTQLAIEALQQIRNDILRRKWLTIVSRYLIVFAGWCLLGLAFGVVLNWAASHFAWLVGLTGFGLVIMASLPAAWFSAVYRSWQISFEGIPEFLHWHYEPFIRMLSVVILALILALFLLTKIISIQIGSVDLGGFPDSVTLALSLGAIVGLSARALSAQLTERVQKVVLGG